MAGKEKASEKEIRTAYKKVSHGGFTAAMPCGESLPAAVRWMDKNDFHGLQLRYPMENPYCKQL